MSEAATNIDLFRPRMEEYALTSVGRVARPDQFGRVYIGQGPTVEQFEQDLKAFLGSPYDVLTVNSGTSALDLALHLCGLNAQEMAGGRPPVVISTPMTCTATNSPIVTRGGRILWADVDPITGLISPSSVARLVKYARANGHPIAAVMAVDWGGRLCDYSALRAAADGIPIIQDAAHSFGATFEARPFLSASHGDYVCFSFQAIKHLTTVDGGALVCTGTAARNTERARLLRWYGLDRRSRADFRCEQMIEEVGYKYHMNDVAAAIGIQNLHLVPDTLNAHRKASGAYTLLLAGPRAIKVPAWDANSAWWLFTILASDRDALIAYLAERGIAASPVHARNDIHPGFMDAALNTLDARPGLDYFSAHEVAIPFGWWLSTEDQIRVLSAVAGWAAIAEAIPEPPSVEGGF